MEYAAIQSYQVLQRDKENKAHVHLSSGEVEELSVGGPYTVGEAHHILVGDIWVLAGQSNMEGVGDLSDLETPSPWVHSFQSREQWAVAEEPLHWLAESPRLVHHLLSGETSVPDPLPQHDPTRTKGAGLGLTFAKERSMRTGVPIGLIPAAHGGTSLEQWSPELRSLGDASLYGAMLQRIDAVGGSIAGILWYQGESEAGPQQVERYQRGMDVFLAALRRDLALPDLPFLYVQISRFVSSDASEEGWNDIREIQRRWVATQAGVSVVSAIDLELDDLIHIGTQGLKRLGRRLVDVASGLPTPTIQEVHVDTIQARVYITYSNVRGGLRAAGRPAGFSLRNSQRIELPIIYKITLEEQTAVLHLTTNELPPQTFLWYGWGTNPYCNITDAADAALLASGPMLLD